MILMRLHKRKPTQETMFCALPDITGLPQYDRVSKWTWKLLPCNKALNGVLFSTPDAAISVS